MSKSADLEKEVSVLIDEHLTDWCRFAEDVFGVYLDDEQKDILRSVQHNPKTSVRSGTARGKDFVSAVAALCFLYLTPTWNEKGELAGNTKVCVTAPTDRQVGNIMVPELTRLFNKAKARGFDLPGRLVGYDIRMEEKEWFLTGFKADGNSTESWSGFHAVNTMFVVTEASGLDETVFNAIEGNLQGNSRLLIVFNDNTGTGYAAASQKKPGWHKFRLDSLNAPNVKAKKNIIPGQVDWEWVSERVKDWCQVISAEDYIEEEGDFYWEDENGRLCYRPNDLFRVKVRGMAPKVSAGVLIPYEWIESAQKRYKEHKANGWRNTAALRLGVDVAGMGRDSSAFCFRYGDLVEKFEMVHSGGVANHMQIVGKVVGILQANTSNFNGFFAQAYIDTIGEGAGVFSRLEEQNQRVFSVKFSGAAEYYGRTLKDVTEQYEFLNLRAWLYWAIRDWLNPINKKGAMLPPDDELGEELTETKWEFLSNGKIKIEPKEDIKKRLKRSPDKADALANTFYPAEGRKKGLNIADFF